MRSRTELCVAWVGLTLAACALPWAVAPVQADEPASDLVQKKQREQTVRQDTNHLVRRVSTMLRVLDYYGADRRAERQVLGEIATVLSGLSKEQMAEVITRLETAARMPDDKKATKEVSEAYQQHRVILTRLRALLARYEAIKRLDQAAARLDQASKAQLDVRLHTNQLVQDWLTTPPYRRLPNQPTQESITQDVHQQADEETDLGQQVEQVLGELKQLQSVLPHEQQLRVKQAEYHAHEQQLTEHMSEAARELRGWHGSGLDRWHHAGTLQRQAATDLQDLAQMLRTPTDRLGTLREARERLDRILAKQQDLVGDAAVQHDPRVQDRERQRQQQGQPRHAQEQGDEQGRLQHATHGVRALLQPQAAPLADRLGNAEQNMHQAENDLRKNAADKARPRQEDAASTLKSVRRDLDRALAAAEKDQLDPLAALQKKAETVEHLLQEQKDLRQKTAEARQTGHPERLPHMTEKQSDLARQTADARQQTSPAQTSTQQALGRATEAMHAAAQALASQKGQRATAHEDRAIESLTKAKKQLDEQVAAIQKRRDDTAALEDARARLEQLGRQEKQVADQAHALGQQNDQGRKEAGSHELGMQQEHLAGETKALHNEIEHAAADAARHVAEAAKNMDAAKHALAQHQTAPAAGQAREAANKLQKAADALARAVEQNRGEDLADQAAMQPDKLDPENAAEQLAKALEQARQAAAQSQRAANHASHSATHQPKQLARLQKQVAQRAAALNLDKAHKPADAAAEALARGDLGGAVDQQKKALHQLQEAGEQTPAEHTAPADPAHAQNAPQLAQAQKQLLDATRALARSQEATQAAQAALQQAQAQSPAAFASQLQEAGRALAEAGQHLRQAQPQPAHRAQEQAIAQMTRALGTLQAAAAAMPHPGKQPGQPASAQAQLPGQHMLASQPGPTRSTQRAQSVQLRGRSNGSRVTRAQPSRNEPPRLGDVMGDGSFLHLPPRQRELIQQALNASLPPEYAALIQQYYVNVARGKPAARPRAPEKP